MRPSSHEESAGRENGFAITAGGTDRGSVRRLAGPPPRSAFLGLRVAMPLALLLWGLVMTALWTLMR
jgi:hypothetical protein